MKNILTLSMLVLCSQAVLAEPTTSPVSIKEIRTYSNGDSFVTLTAVTPTAALCATDTFKLAATQPAAKQLYATLLSAAAQGSQIRIEVPDTGCSGVSPSTGWGTLIQSVYINP